MGIGINGFEWDELKVGKEAKRGPKTDDAYIYIRKDKPSALMINHVYVEMAELHEGDRLKLFHQGKAVFMLQSAKDGPIVVGKKVGNYVKIGAVELARILHGFAEADRFEVRDAGKGYILFIPIKEAK